MASAELAQAVDTVDNGPCNDQRMAIWPPAMFGQAWMLSLRDTADGPTVERPSWEAARMSTPAMDVPWTQPVRSGSSSPMPPADSMAWAAAATAKWVKRAEPEATRSSIHCRGSKSLTVAAQACSAPGSPWYGAGPMPTSPALQAAPNAS